jgi:hypothetical protein
MSTVITSELISYGDYVSLTVIANAMTLKRPDLKKKVYTLLSAVITRDSDTWTFVLYVMVFSWARNRARNIGVPRSET